MNIFLWTKFIESTGDFSVDQKIVVFFQCFSESAFWYITYFYQEFWWSFVCSFASNCSKDRIFTNFKSILFNFLNLLLNLALRNSLITGNIHVRIQHSQENRFPFQKYIIISSFHKYTKTFYGVWNAMLN